MNKIETIEITNERVDRWKEYTLGEVAKYFNGRAFKPKEWENEGLPIIRIQNLNDPEASYNYSSEDYKDRYLVQNGDLLFAWSASLDAYIWKGDEAWLNQHIFKVVPRDFIDKRFLFYYLKRIIMNLYAKSHGSGMVHVTKKKFENTEILVPPLSLQQHIVEKIEELFSDLDNGIRNLEKAKQQLETYKQSVLKAAFEGKLTKQWRMQQDELPTPEELKAQIEEERKRYREQQLEEWRLELIEWEKACGPGRKPRKPRKPKDVDPIPNKKLEGLHEFPQEWSWMRLGDVMSKPKYGTSQKCDYDIDGTAVLRIPNIGEGGSISDDDLKFSEFTEKEKDKYRLREEDILTIRSNGSVDLVGKCAVIRERDTNFLFAGYLIRLRPYKKAVNSKYIYYALNTITLRRQIENKAKSTSGVNNINSGELQHLTLPICSLKEQEQIVNSIESKISVVDQNIISIDQELQKAEALRQSILKKAFEGHLIDPFEESQASEKISKFQQMQMIGHLIEVLQKNYRMQFGELVLVKYMYLIDRVYNFRTGFKFKKHNHGPYDPNFKKLLYTSSNFFTRKDPGYFNITPAKRNQLLSKKPFNTEVYEEAINSISKFTKKFYPKGISGKKLELLTTVCKIIEDNQSVILKNIRVEMANWEIEDEEFDTKAEKFSKDETERCLDFILKKGWEKELIN